MARRVPAPFNPCADMAAGEGFHDSQFLRMPLESLVDVSTGAPDAAAIAEQQALAREVAPGEMFDGFTYDEPSPLEQGAVEAGKAAGECPGNDRSASAEAGAPSAGVPAS